MDCPGCLQELRFGKKQAIVPCGHIYHKRCLKGASNCKLCRKKATRKVKFTFGKKVVKETSGSTGTNTSGSSRSSRSTGTSTHNTSESRPIKRKYNKVAIAKGLVGTGVTIAAAIKGYKRIKKNKKQLKHDIETKYIEEHQRNSHTSSSSIPSHPVSNLSSPVSTLSLGNNSNVLPSFTPLINLPSVIKIKTENELSQLSNSRAIVPFVPFVQAHVPVQKNNNNPYLEFETKYWNLHTKYSQYLNTFEYIITHSTNMNQLSILNTNVSKLSEIVKEYIVSLTKYIKEDKTHKTYGNNVLNEFNSLKNYLIKLSNNITKKVRNLFGFGSRRK